MATYLKRCSEGGTAACPTCGGTSTGCFYSASLVLDGTISIDDLPDKIKVRLQTATPPYPEADFDFLKQSDGSYLIDPAVASGVYAGSVFLQSGVSFKAAPASVFDFGGAPLWGFVSSNPFLGFTNNSIGQCIPPYFTSENFVRDAFDDHYTTGGVTLTRVSDYLWTGGGHALYWSATGWGWVLDGHSKTGFQNSPVGSYSGGGTVTE